MNNQEFDNMIRAHVENNTVTPSAQVGKSLGRKMLFKNIWFFHKTKALLILLLLGSVSFPLWNKLSYNTELNPKITKYPNKESFIPNSKQNEGSTLNSEKRTEKLIKEQNKDKALTSTDITNNKKLEDESKTNLLIKNKQTETQRKSDKTIKVHSHEEKKVLKNNNDIKKIKLSNAERQFLTADIGTNDSDKLSYNSSSKKAYPLNSNIDKSIVDFTFDYQNKDVDYVKYKGTFSIDVYATPFNQLNIKNELNENELSSDYDKKEWDFYRNEGIVNSGFAGGIRANYNWKNILVSSGLKISSLRDYKPMYKFENVQNEEVLEYFNLDEISGVQIQDKDSAHYVFHTENNEELIHKLENDKYNTYKYLSIPLRIGYEFKQDKYSIAVQGGGIYSRLLNVKGSYLRKYNNQSELDFYYNRGIETAQLENENTMLKKNYFSLLGAIVANVKIANNFDVFGEINYTQSLNNITKKNYFINKKTQTVSANFGIRYYLKPKTKLI